MANIFPFDKIHCTGTITMFRSNPWQAIQNIYSAVLKDGLKIKFNKYREYYSFLIYREKSFLWAFKRKKPIIEYNIQPEHYVYIRWWKV
jgi:hypothetical protein